MKRIIVSLLIPIFLVLFPLSAEASYDNTFYVNGDSCVNFKLNSASIPFPYPRFDFIENISGSNNMVSAQINFSGISAWQYQYSENGSSSIGSININTGGSPVPIQQICQNDNKLLYYKNGELKGTLNYVWALPLSSIRVRYENGIQDLEVVQGLNIIQPPNDQPQVSTLSNTDIFTVDEYIANGSFTDSDYSTSWTATVDYGDGSGVQNLPLSGKNFSLNHTYQTGGTFTVTVAVTDNQGLTGTSQATITVTAIDIKVGGMTSMKYYNTEHPIILINNYPEGLETATCSIMDNDTNTSVDNNATYEVLENTSGIVLSLGYGQIPSGWSSSKDYHLECLTTNNTTLISNDFKFRISPTIVEVVQNDNLIDVYFTPNNEPLPESWLSARGWFDDLGYGTCEYNVSHNNQTLSVCHLDLNINPQLPNTNEAYLFVGGTINGMGYGVQSTTPFRVTALTPNGAPSVYQLPDAVLNVGDTYELTNGSVYDNGSSIWTGTVDYGDGTGENPITFNAPNYYDFSLNHTYNTYGTFTITVTLTDEFGLTGTSTAIVTVPAPNVDPVISGFQISPTQVNTNANVTATAIFSDDNPTDTHTSTIDWGDGNTSEGTVTEASGSGSVTGEHSYSSSGNYIVTVTVTDNHDASDAQIASVEVINNEPVTLYPTADSYIKQGSSNENEGSSTFARLQSSGHNRALVKFDQSQINTAVNGAQNYTAKLRFTISDNGNNWGATGRPISLHRLTQDWVEGNGFNDGNSPAFRGTGSGITWGCATDSNIQNTSKNCTGADEWNMTNSSLWPFASAATATTTITNNQSGVVEFDVTSDVQAFISGANQNFGWLLKKENEGQNGRIEFGTKESSSTPTLIISFN